ncbi:hypothetical protein PALB_19340 [Pseudoalteromonas luteoviolacea B = ATCC 29581]|nr:hypothetical protein PALB_19340 [Pseudoalteromonas luteoviolacea B = ATCC 29581]
MAKFRLIKRVIVASLWMFLAGCSDGVGEQASLQVDTFEHNTVLDIQIHLQSLHEELLAREAIPRLSRHALLVLGHLHTLQEDQNNTFELCAKDFVATKTIYRAFEKKVPKVDLADVLVEIKSNTSMAQCYFVNSTIWHLAKSYFLIEQGNLAEAEYTLVLALMHFEQLIRSIELTPEPVVWTEKQVVDQKNKKVLE